MKTILTVIGARPQFIKAAAISRAIRNSFKDELKEIILHTGQHYDEKMSQIFFDQMGVPQPDVNINSGSGSHGKQTGFMMEKIEEQLLHYKPDGLLIYGDTNSTLAGALAASKLHIPVIHVESGLRSFNKKMPEEINRITADHVSTLLFCPTDTGVQNLKNENFNTQSSAPFSIDNPKVYNSGDIMYDNSIYFSQVSAESSSVLVDNDLKAEEYVLCTIHRPSNTDSKEKLKGILLSLLKLASQYRITFLLPIHPRTKNRINEFFKGDEILEELKTNEFFKIIEPVGFLDMTELERNSKVIVTDSGGVQKEAFFFEKPCVVLRQESEWTELMEAGCARLTKNDLSNFESNFEYFINNTDLEFPKIFGDGKSSEFICEEIIKHI